MSESKAIVLRSASNPTIRRMVRMRDSNRVRRKAGSVLVDGWRETAQALDAGLKLLHAYLPLSFQDESESATDPVIQKVMRDTEPTWVTDPLMSKICFGQSPRGVVAEFAEPSRSLDELALPTSPLILVLDCIEKPGNVGAVFRSADAAGIDAVILCGSTDLFNPNAIRSSLGCVFHVPAAVGSEEEVKACLIGLGVRVLAARVESSLPLWSTELNGPLAIVLGNEAEGLNSRWQELAGKPIAGIRIPMSGKVDSLNVSVSAAVIGFEAVRQRNSGG
ncbi:MAG: TrmH family RNA methyltransferase [Rubripirellula sp.]